MLRAALLSGLLLVLAGCVQDEIARRAAEDGQAWRAATAFLERRWQSRQPCADCAGIEVSLMLRQDFVRREYRLSEAYLAHGAGDQARFERAGEWSVHREATASGEAIVYVLDPSDPLRASAWRLRPDGGLERWPAASGTADGNRWRLSRIALD